MKISGDGPALPRGRVLVHGVSLGEVALMQLVVRQLEQRWHCHCLLTTSTDTGAESLEKNWPDHPQTRLPLDVPWAVERFLSRTQPRALVLLELELWPRLLAACHRRGIPVYLINARVSARSFAGYRRLRPLLTPLLSPLRVVAAQNQLWGARLRALGCRSVQVTGSLKADLVRPATDDAIATLRQRLALDPQRPLLVIASTSDPEESVCIGAWQKACPDWQLVICPRHPPRGAAVETVVRNHGCSVWRWSQSGTPSPSAVRIIDAIGQLAALYALADIAIVGGSLGSRRHGQNMLEPAAHGICTVVGPDTSNFPDAMALLRQANGVVETTVTDLAATLSTLVAQPQLRQRIGAAGRQAWLRGRGADQRTLDLLAQYPPPA